MIAKNATANEPDEEQARRRTVGSAFVKASQVTFSSGKKLKTINTIKQARNGRRRAGQKEKKSLSRLINKAKKVHKTNKYYLSSDYHLRRNFNFVLSFAKKVHAHSAASKNEVADAKRFLAAQEKALDGKKVLVNNLHHLTNYEAEQIRDKAIDALANSDEDVDVEFNKKNTVLREIEPDHRLKISDFAKQRKRISRRK